jgi:DNA invertase Pin-like site-specific DNA recombinase
METILMKVPKTPGTPPAMTYEQYKQIIELKELKEKHLKTYVQLAKELGLTVSTVTSAARKGVKRYDYAMWKEEQEK